MLTGTTPSNWSLREETPWNACYLSTEVTHEKLFRGCRRLSFIKCRAADPLPQMQIGDWIKFPCFYLIITFGSRSVEKVQAASTAFQSLLYITRIYTTTVHVTTKSVFEVHVTAAHIVQ